MASAARAAPAQAPLRAALLAYFTLLEREQQLLTHPDAEALQAVAIEKQALHNQIQALAAPATTQQDPALRELVQRTHALNLTNARLVALQRNSCESRLHILRGVDPATSLYRANGYLGR